MTLCVPHYGAGGELFIRCKRDRKLRLRKQHEKEHWLWWSRCLHSPLEFYTLTPPAIMAPPLHTLQVEYSTIAIATPKGDKCLQILHSRSSRALHLSHKLLGTTKTHYKVKFEADFFPPDPEWGWEKLKKPPTWIKDHYRDGVVLTNPFRLQEEIPLQRTAHFEGFSGKVDSLLVQLINREARNQSVLENTMRSPVFLQRTNWVSCENSRVFRSHCNSQNYH